MAQNKPFKFTQQQRTELLFSWAHQSARNKAQGFIDQVEKIIESQIKNALPDEKSPSEESEDRKNILERATLLHGALNRQSIHSRHMLERLLEREHQPLESVSGTPHRDQLIAYLETVKAAMTVLTSDKLRSNPPKGEFRRRQIMRSLVDSYRVHFSKYPSKTYRGPFRRFLSRLAKILDMPLGEDLLVRAIEDVKQQLRAAEKIRQELEKIFPRG